MSFVPHQTTLTMLQESDMKQSDAFRVLIHNPDWSAASSTLDGRLQFRRQYGRDIPQPTNTSAGPLAMTFACTAIPARLILSDCEELRKALGGEDSFVWM
jgi:hypothetical protein